MPPGSTIAVPVLTTFKSAEAPSESESVDELFAGFTSVTPAGAATEAVFASVPVALGSTVAVTVKVAVPPTARLTVVAMFPATGPG